MDIVDPTGESDWALTDRDRTGQTWRIYGPVRVGSDYRKWPDFEVCYIACEMNNSFIISSFSEKEYAFALLLLTMLLYSVSSNTCFNCRCISKNTSKCWKVSQFTADYDGSIFQQKNETKWVRSMEDTFQRPAKPVKLFALKQCWRNILFKIFSCFNSDFYQRMRNVNENACLSGIVHMQMSKDLKLNSFSA